MRRKAVRFIPVITTILIMLAIFGFSSQNREESSKISVGITEKIVNILPGMKNLTQQQKIAKIKTYEAVIRKIAHFVMYMLLGLSAAIMFRTMNFKHSFYWWIFAVLLAVLYASGDEIHQIFVSGRGPQVKDVVIDTCGAVFGIGIFYLNILRKLK